MADNCTADADPVNQIGASLPTSDHCIHSGDLSLS